jgi:hypothetical protein
VSESKAEKELHTEALGKLKLKKSQREHGRVHSASLRTKILRVMHMQFLGAAAGLQVCTEALRELKRDGTVQA